MRIKNAEGTTESLMFYVAYTLDGADAATRPVTFAYNGGPGSATIWLHMGALGPRTVMMDPQGFMPQPPFRVHDNQYTPLDRTDVVLIDAIGTGWSRAADAAAARKYQNPDGDVQAFGEFSPKMAVYGAAIVCADDPGVKSIRPMISRPLVT